MSDHRKDIVLSTSVYWYTKEEEHECHKHETQLGLSELIAFLQKLEKQDLRALCVRVDSRYDD